MAEYIPPALDWVREQVEEYEGSGGTKGTTLRDTGSPTQSRVYRRKARNHDVSLQRNALRTHVGPSN